MSKEKKIEIITNSVAETNHLAKKIAAYFKTDILKAKKALVVGLIGDLGSGKTTFVQGLALALGVKQKILSPTFVLMKKFAFKDKENKAVFYHIDCYRLRSEKDLKALDFKEIIRQEKTIVLIEWAEKIRKALPKDTIIIEFKYLDKNKRNIKYEKINYY